MQKPEIIAGEIQNLTDARYFAAREVQYLSFRFDLNFNGQQAAAIREWVDGVQMMGAFSYQNAQEIREIATFAGLDSIETDMFFDPKAAKELSADFLLFQRIVLETRTNQQELEDLLASGKNIYSGFILDFRKNNLDFSDLRAGQPLDPNLLKELAAEFPLYLSIQLREDELDLLLEDIKPTGLELIGGTEEKTGFKSFDEADLIFDALEEKYDY